MQIYARVKCGNALKTLTLTVESCNNIDVVKAKIEDMVGIHPSVQSLYYGSHRLEDRRTFADYNIRDNCTLDMFTRLGEPPYIYVKTSNGNSISVAFKGLDTVNNVKAKVKEKEGIPLDNHALFFVGKQLEDTYTLYHYGITEGLSLCLVQLSDATVDDPLLSRAASQTTSSSKANPNTFKAKLKVCALHKPKATKVAKEVISEVRPGASSLVGSELEDLKHQMACKRKEFEATVSKLTHKNKVVSARCASYEGKLAALETENKKLKQQVSSEQGQAFLEGEKAKWLKSVEFLDHLTEGALEYFDYGFDSCQKQAEQQGFVGQLNKDAALQEAPELKLCEFSDQP